MALAALAQIDWTRGDGQWLALLYPHVSILIAAANPFGMLGLGVVGAVASGFLLQKVAEIIAQRAIPLSTGIILTLALAARIGGGRQATSRPEARHRKAAGSDAPRRDSGRSVGAARARAARTPWQTR